MEINYANLIHCVDSCARTLVLSRVCVQHHHSQRNLRSRLLNVSDVVRNVPSPFNTVGSTVSTILLYPELKSSSDMHLV